VRENGQKSANAAGTARPTKAPSKRCLIVDESRVIRAVSRKILESRGYEVEEAENGNDGLSACGKWHPDAVLIEWQLPEMSGIEFIRQLPAEVGPRMPKVIFCSSEAGIESIREAVQAGAAEYIMKPFDSDIFDSKLLLAGLT